MELLLSFFKDYSVLLNFALVWLVVPVYRQIKASNTRNEDVLKKLDEISSLNREIVHLHQRANQIEEAILFLTDNKDIKTVVKIIRGGETSGKGD